MRFVTVRDLRGKSAEVWRQLAEEHDMVITSKGKPIALLASISEDTFEESLGAIRRARAMAVLRAVQTRSVKLGKDKMTMEEIDAEIAAYRKERRNARSEGSPAH